jgi:ParB family transcriptional regulator, chromosome partitioning protein
MSAARLCDLLHLNSSGNLPVAGGRRLAALKLLAKRKEVEKDVAVGGNVLAGEDDTEISLAENDMREAMHPADQLIAFRRLMCVRFEFPAI